MKSILLSYGESHTRTVCFLREDHLVCVKGSRNELAQWVAAQLGQQRKLLHRDVTFLFCIHRHKAPVHARNLLAVEVSALLDVFNLLKGKRGAHVGGRGFGCPGGVRALQRSAWETRGDSLKESHALICTHDCHHVDDCKPAVATPARFACQPLQWIQPSHFLRLF